MPLGPSSPSEDSGRNRERTVRENDVRQSGISNTGSQNTDGRASGYSPEPVDDTPPETPDTSVLSVSARPYQKNKTAKYRLRVQDPNNDLVAAEYAVRRPQTAVVQFARSPDIEWENQYDSNVHAYARLSDDFFRNEITGLLDSSLGRTEFRSIRFARSAEKPGVSSKSYNPDTNSTTWSRTPPSGGDPLWVIHGVINTSTTTLVENWSDPLRRVPYSWTEIKPKEEERGSSEYIISEPFKKNGSDSFEIFWRVRHRPSQEKRGGNEFDRDPDAEFTANLRLLGQDARLELDGDEDTASYKIATSRGTVGFPDPSGGEYVEGRTFTGGNQINLGYLEPGQQINVSVRAYSDVSEDGNVQDGGQTRRLTLTTSQERPVPQVRFGPSKTGKFYSEYDGSYSYMQVSFNRGLTWEKAVDIEQESAASGEITSAYYFARGFGAPEINPFGDNPGSAWSDTPPTGESTLWVTSGPVDDTGTLAGGRWETPYPVVAEVPPKTLPPTEAAAQYSATDADPENAAAWDKTYDPDLNHEYIRLSWDQGNSWQSVHMETPTANPKDSDGKTITRNPVNRFTRSSTAPTVTDRTTYNGPDFTKWTDLPPTGSEDIWMISALADLDSEILVAGDWSEPIRLRNLSDPGNLIEFGESVEGPWTPFYENDTTHFHLSLNNTLSWTGADQVSDAYFQKSDSQPTTPTDPSTNASWAENPEFSNAGSNQGEGTSGTPTWITRPDGVGGWTQPMKVRRDSGKRGPESDEVTIQYSADKVSWHDEFREGDVWMRQRVGEGVWQGPTRIVGEGGQNGVYLAYYFQANNSPDTAPKINANDDPTQDRGSGWVDGPGQALDNGGRYVWGITAQFLVDQSQTEDIRQTDWDGPYRVNGEDATQRFIRPTNGTAIKNSNPNKTLGLETVEIKGSRESLISSGDPKLYVEDSGSYTTVSNYFSGISDDHEPVFSVTEIQGNLTVYLRDTDGNNLDTITLADLTDGVSAGYVLSPDGFAVTHYSGRDTDAVKPGSLPLVATFVDSEGTEHQQQINVNPTENASKNLEVSWSAATSSDSDPQSDQVSFTVKSNGASVTSPVTSPRELVFEFTGTDANTGEKTVFSEQVQFTEDDGIYKIKSLDGATLREGGDNLRFEVTRTDGEGTSTVGLTSSGFKLVLRPAGSATEFTGSPATIADSDLNTGPQTLQLQDGSGNVLDSITVIKASLGVSSLQVIDREQITENGSQVGKLTFEVADRYKDSVDTITTRKASGRNLKSGDAFGSDITGTESPPYTETVNLEEKRSSYIEVKVTYTDSQPTTRQTFSFDHDLRPEAKYIVPKGKAEPYLAVLDGELEYQSYPSIQYYVSAQGDEDVASFRTVFIHAEGTSNEEKFVYERKGRVLDNVPLHPTKDLLDPSGFILGGATIREDLESGESRNDYTARVKVEAYSDWDPDANNGNGGVAGKKDQNAFDQQVGIEGGAFPEFTPEITRFNANPVHRGGGSALLSVGVNEDAEGFQINWKTFDKDGNLLQTYSDVNGDPSAIVDPGTAQFSAPTPPGPDATDSNGNNIGPGYGWIEVTPIGSPAYITENIKGESERISIGPPKAYNTLFSVTGGSSSTTAVGTDTEKAGQLNVEVTSDDGGQKYNVNAPQDIGTSATPTFSGLDFGGSNSVNEISDDTSLADGSSTSLPTENAVKTYVDNQSEYNGGTNVTIDESADPPEINVSPQGDTSGLNADKLDGYEASDLDNSDEIEGVRINLASLAAEVQTHNAALQIVVPEARELIAGNAIGPLGDLSEDRTVTVQEEDLAGTFLAPDGSGALAVQTTGDLVGDGGGKMQIGQSVVQTREIDESIAPTWTGVHTHAADIEMQSQQVRFNDGVLQGDGNGALEVLKADESNQGTLRVDEIVAHTVTVVDEIDQRNVNDLRVEDQYIVVNENQSGTPGLDGGLVAERGGSEDAYIEWEEGLDVWGTRLENGTLKPITLRDTSMADTGIPYWNQQEERIETDPDLKFLADQSQPFEEDPAGKVQTKAGIGHPDYTAEKSHWYITPGGLGDFRTLLADELRVEAFIAEVEEALAGEDFLTKSFAKLDEGWTVPQSGSSADITLQNLPGLAGSAVFQEGDTVRLRYVNRSGGGLTVADVWAEVTKPTGFDATGETQTWSATVLDAGGVAGETIEAGSVALDYGVPGDFLIERSVLNPSGSDIAPYDRMLKWKDNDGDGIPDDYEVLNLRGRLDGLNKAYASGFGTYTETARFTSDIIVGDIEAGAAGDQTGSYLRFSDSDGLEVVYGDGFGGTSDGRLSSAVLQLEDDVRLLAQEIVQEQESRAGLEITASETEARVQAQAEIIGDDFSSDATISAFADETKSRFESSVQYTKDGEVEGEAKINLEAGPNGSSAVLAAEDVRISGNTTFFGGSGIPGGVLEDDYTEKGTENVTIRGSGEPNSTTTRGFDSDGDGTNDDPIDGDFYIDTSDGDKPYVYDGPKDKWFAAYTSINGGDIETGTVNLDRLSFANAEEGYIDAQYLNITASDLTINSNTTFFGSEYPNASGIPGDALQGDYTDKGTESVILTGSGDPTTAAADPKRNDGSIQNGDMYLDTSDGEKPYIYNGEWRAAYTQINGGNITTGQITLDRMAFGEDGEIAAEYLGITVDNLDIDANDVTISGSSKNDAQEAILQLEDDVRLLAENLTQEKESRASLELTASKTESRFEADVTFAGNESSISLVANDNTSEARIAGDSIILDGEVDIQGDAFVDDLFARNLEINSGGEITSEGEGFKINADGSGQLAGGDINWDNSGNLEVGSNATVRGDAIVEDELFAQNIEFTGQIRTSNYEITLNSGYGLSMLASQSVGEKNALSWFQDDGSGSPVTQSYIQGSGKGLDLKSEGEVKMMGEDFIFTPDPNLDTGSGAPRFKVSGMKMILEGLKKQVYANNDWEIYRTDNGYLKINVPQTSSGPTADLRTGQIGGLEVTLDAGGSYGGSSGMEYKFDYTDDGSYDTSWSTNPESTTTYNSYQSYTARVKVKDGDGKTDTDTVSFTLSDSSDGGSGGSGGSSGGDSSIAF